MVQGHRTIVRLGKRLHAVANKDQPAIPDPQEMMERTVAPELMVPQVTLALTLRPAQLFYHRPTSVLAPLHLATVVQKDNLDPLAKVDPQDHLAPMVYSRHLAHQALLDQQGQMAKVDPKVPQVMQENKCQVKQARRDHQALQDQLVNQVQAASPAMMENQARKAPLVLKVIEAQLVAQATPAALENQAMLATKVCQALVLNAHRLVWLQAIRKTIWSCKFDNALKNQ